MKISIIIPIYNAIEEVKKLLTSILQNINFEITEVILVNDSSNENTTNFLKDFISINKNFIYLRNEENLGFVQTCNKGMSVATGDILVLLNSDTEIPYDFSEKIIKCFNHDKKIGVASPIATSSLKHFIILPEKYDIESVNKLLDKKHNPKYPEIFACEGFCFCIRKEVVSRQGGLDTVYGKGYCEEVDFALRAKTNGWKNVLIDNLYVYHRAHTSFSDKQRNELFEKNNKIFLERWGKELKKAGSHTPVEDIEDKIFLNVFIYWLYKILSIRKSTRSNHYILTILGLKIKIKRKH